MKKLLSIVTCLFVFSVFAQNTKPKLVVGIVVDQMRADYISKYWDKYEDGGFKKLIAEGFYCKNTHYNYVPTYTGPGHASIYTGTTPATHGIIANTWYDKRAKSTTYCVQDDSVKTLGAENVSGFMSPKKLKASTITDELKLATLMKSKVIGISLKDRGAILPAGHSADAAYWFDGSTGHWVSSTYYMDKLPGWVEGVNNANPSEALIKAGWNTLLPIQNYVESYSDDNKYEGLFAGEDKPVFPHNLVDNFQSNKFGTIKQIPQGNTLTRLFAESAIENENMGKDGITDFLTVSFSATDYIGHMYGPQSVEVEDAYLRLDKDIEAFIKILDVKVGYGNYTVFLTSDHGAVEVPAYLKDKKQASGYIVTASIAEELNNELSKALGEGSWVDNYSNGQFFFSTALKNHKEYLRAYQIAEIFLLNKEGVANVYNREQVMIGTSIDQKFKNIQMGFNQKTSGDVLLLFEPGWIVEHYGKTGTTHGSPYNYDTHVPLIWYGKGINKGETTERVEITDIAITLSMLLNINIPNGSIGEPIIGITKN